MKSRDRYYYVPVGNTINISSANMYGLCYPVPMDVAKQLGLIDTPAGAESTPNVEKVRRATAERNEWLYDQYRNHPEKTSEAIRREAKSKGWGVHSDAHLLKCIDAHCNDHNLPITRRNPPKP
jgi:hypothetical protein